jgi:hypothetical protein
MTKTDYDLDRSLVLIEGLSHFLRNFLQNLTTCQTNFICKNDKNDRTLKLSIDIPVKTNKSE